METDPIDGTRDFAVIFRIDPAIFDVFPELRIGVVKAVGLNNHGECRDIREKIKQIQNKIRSEFDIGTLTENPKIRNWRNAYNLFGAKPKKHRSSVENLCLITLEGRDLRSINKIVDIYNCVSLKHMVPVGGDDLAKVVGDIVLRFAKGDEPFYPIGLDEAQTARIGEVIYADDREVLCRRWNWRESDKTKMTEETQDVLLVSEGLPPVTGEEMEGIVEELVLLVEKYCGGVTSRDVLSAEKCEWELQSIPFSRS